MMNNTYKYDGPYSCTLTTYEGNFGVYNSCVEYGKEQLRNFKQQIVKNVIIQILLFEHLKRATKGELNGGLHNHEKLLNSNNIHVGKRNDEKNLQRGFTPNRHTVYLNEECTSHRENYHANGWNTKDGQTVKVEGYMVHRESRKTKKKYYNKGIKKKRHIARREHRKEGKNGGNNTIRSDSPRWVRLEKVEREASMGHYNEGLSTSNERINDHVCAEEGFSEITKSVENISSHLIERRKRSSIDHALLYDTVTRKICLEQSICSLHKMMKDIFLSAFFPEGVEKHSYHLANSLLCSDDNPVWLCTLGEVTSGRDLIPTQRRTKRKHFLNTLFNYFQSVQKSNNLYELVKGTELPSQEKSKKVHTTVRKSDGDKSSVSTYEMMKLVYHLASLQKDSTILGGISPQCIHLGTSLFRAIIENIFLKKETQGSTVKSNQRSSYRDVSCDDICFEMNFQSEHFLFNPIFISNWEMRKSASAILNGICHVNQKVDYAIGGHIPHQYKSICDEMRYEKSFSAHGSEMYPSCFSAHLGDPILGRQKQGRMNSFFSLVPFLNKRVAKTIRKSCNLYLCSLCGRKNWKKKCTDRFLLGEAEKEKINHLYCVHNGGNQDGYHSKGNRRNEHVRREYKLIQGKPSRCVIHLGILNRSAHNAGVTPPRGKKMLYFKMVCKNTMIEFISLNGEEEVQKSWAPKVVELSYYPLLPVKSVDESIHRNFSKWSEDPMAYCISNSGGDNSGNNYSGAYSNGNCRGETSNGGGSANNYGGMKGSGGIGGGVGGAGGSDDNNEENNNNNNNNTNRDGFHDPEEDEEGNANDNKNGRNNMENGRNSFNMHEMKMNDVNIMYGNHEKENATNMVNGNYVDNNTGNSENSYKNENNSGGSHLNNTGKGDHFFENGESNKAIGMVKGTSNSLMNKGSGGGTAEMSNSNMNYIPHMSGKGGLSNVPPNQRMNFPNMFMGGNMLQPHGAQNGMHNSMNSINGGGGDPMDNMQNMKQTGGGMLKNKQNQFIPPGQNAGDNKVTSSQQHSSTSSSNSSMSPNNFMPNQLHQQFQIQQQMHLQHLFHQQNMHPYNMVQANNPSKFPIQQGAQKQANASILKIPQMLSMNSLDRRSNSISQKMPRHMMNPMDSSSNSQRSANTSSISSMTNPPNHVNSMSLKYSYKGTSTPQHMSSSGSSNNNNSSNSGNSHAQQNHPPTVGGQPQQQQAQQQGLQNPINNMNHNVGLNMNHNLSTKQNVQQGILPGSHLLPAKQNSQQLLMQSPGSSTTQKGLPQVFQQQMGSTSKSMSTTSISGSINRQPNHVPFPHVPPNQQNMPPFMHGNAMHMYQQQPPFFHRGSSSSQPMGPQQISYEWMQSPYMQHQYMLQQCQLAPQQLFLQQKQQSMLQHAQKQQNMAYPQQQQHPQQQMQMQNMENLPQHMRMMPGQHANMPFKQNVTQAFPHMLKDNMIPGSTNFEFMENMNDMQRMASLKNHVLDVNTSNNASLEGTIEEDIFDSNYHCDICNKDITHAIRIRCAECVDFDLCVNCFSSGKEMKSEKCEHYNYHNYIPIPKYDFPLYKLNWSAEEELLLLDGISKYGFGNWEQVADLVNSAAKIPKTDKQCEKHYYNFYLKSNCAPMPDNKRLLIKPDGNPYDIEHVAEKDINENDDYVQPKSKKNNRTQIIGYWPLRGDFDIEYDNDAELLLADMEFKESDLPQQKELKLQVLEIYNSKLDERIYRKRTVIERGLLDTKSQMQRDKKRTKEEKELYTALKPLSRFHSPQHHEYFIQLLLEEQKLRQRLTKLQEWKTLGLQNIEQVQEYEIEKNRRAKEAVKQQQQQQQPQQTQEQTEKVGTKSLKSNKKECKIKQKEEEEMEESKKLNIDTFVELDLLNEKEVEFCKNMKLPILFFLLIKRLLIMEISNSNLNMLKDINELKLKGYKVGQLYDFFLSFDINQKEELLNNNGNGNFKNSYIRKNEDKRRKMRTNYDYNTFNKSDKVEVDDSNDNGGNAGGTANNAGNNYAGGPSGGAICGQSGTPNAITGDISGAGVSTTTANGSGISTVGAEMGSENAGIAQPMNEDSATILNEPASTGNALNDKDRSTSTQSVGKTDENDNVRPPTDKEKIATNSLSESAPNGGGTTVRDKKSRERKVKKERDEKTSQQLITSKESEVVNSPPKGMSEGSTEISTSSQKKKNSVKKMGSTSTATNPEGEKTESVENLGILKEAKEIVYDKNEVEMEMNEAMRSEVEGHPSAVTPGDAIPGGQEPTDVNDVNDVNAPSPYDEEEKEVEEDYGDLDDDGDDRETNADVDLDENEKKSKKKSTKKKTECKEECSDLVSTITMKTSIGDSNSTNEMLKNSNNSRRKSVEKTKETPPQVRSNNQSKKKNGEANIVEEKKMCSSVIISNAEHSSSGKVKKGTPKKDEIHSSEIFENTCKKRSNSKSKKSSDNDLSRNESRVSSHVDLENENNCCVEVLDSSLELDGKLSKGKKISTPSPTSFSILSKTDKNRRSKAKSDNLSAELLSSSIDTKDNDRSERKAKTAEDNIKKSSKKRKGSTSLVSTSTKKSMKI
ncbi:transcriptional coactivator ADA2, putative [Plasmodium knowlesi strain H]|uniref:Transcriptional coactivator ADA2, putative n=3 Tax=Plasmodium knowlesi TaxID=5850 RepID=A0A5K1UWT3_PLAKH|nr:transcriptional coactivator ADA2, putative [Plasmodium knowlesi strain H]OTN65736.1 putative Ada2-like protein [Plasmodium knowlesi]CAA9987790.1 transcriptional coactivator ADA2, putative [Plasmodium knowlesi strain H]SBO22437.1 transcriptional coactivator ADA2, putative [Plasmodium knowlesi strain H]SBO29539.1 transcriptional coactivator ADA2, putative [Plasmodium knowlesi strain H]VVS77264.1 transcriptional coactivator ADA2, putative [Plasmodium knowlesi strain H]|eukprot:XP_002258787.1 ada2-like protein, putative [Plasmodium knowlesi strain H]